MSNKVSVLVYKKAIGSPIRKSILAYLADKASDDGSGIWVSKQTIADETECGRSTVIRTINDFVAEGLLIESGKRACRGGATVVYTMRLDTLSSLPNSKSETKETRPTAGLVPERDQSRCGTPVVPLRDPHPSRSGTQTILEPSLNQQQQQARENSDDLLSEILSAVGLKNQRIPPHWMPPAATIHVGRWRSDLGLTFAEIIDAAHESRKQHAEPPMGPKALDRVMQNLAATKNASPLSPSKTAGAKNDRSQFDRAINQLANGLSEGTISIDYSDRNPFAVR